MLRQVGRLALLGTSWGVADMMGAEPKRARGSSSGKAGTAGGLTAGAIWAAADRWRIMKG